jgi:hypothetical protein
MSYLPAPGPTRSTLVCVVSAYASWPAVAPATPRPLLVCREEYSRGFSADDP